MVSSPKIIVYSDSNDAVELLRQMTGYFYEILPVSSDSELNGFKSAKKIVASIIIKSTTEDSVFNKLKQVRSIFSELPIMMISDAPSQNEIIDAFRMGVSDFLITPIEAEELISCLNRHTWLQRNNLNISDSFFKRKWNSIKQGFFNLKRKIRIAPPLKISPKHVHTSLNSSILPLPMITGNLSREKGVSIQMLGKFKIKLKGKKEIKLPGHNTKSLLAYLLYHRKKMVHREKLMTMFWPTSIPKCARNCLNVTMHNIRKALNELESENEIIIYKDECYSIHHDLKIETDVELFNRYWRKGLAYENTKNYEDSIDWFYKAIALYKGDFIEDLLYEEWCESERENLKERYLVILDRLSLNAFRQGNYNATIEICNTMLQKDNCLEEIHRRLIASYRAMGARDKAIRQFTKCRHMLQKELGIEPSRTTLELYEKIRT